VEPLTVRIERERIVLSTDDGRTVAVDHDAAAAVRTVVGATVASVRADDWKLGAPTAVTLATLAEARLVEPRGTRQSPIRQTGSGGGKGPSVRIGHLSRGPDVTFHEVLAARRSARTFTALTLADLASVLVPSARVQGGWTSPDGYSATERPTPSAGGRHPIDLAVLAISVDGLEAGLWHFDAGTCELMRGTLDAAVHNAALGRIRSALEGGALPAAAIFAIADFARTLSRYPGGTSLVFRDAGALLATMQLCATAADLASCIVGTAAALPSKGGDGAVTDVGALLLGGSGCPAHAADRF
jgi:SagB-type dehydrogenase family enzyme